MVFYSRSDVDSFILSLKYLGQGSQGVCYKDKDSHKVYKFYHSYFDGDFEGSYRKEEILQFKDIKSSTFIFPKDVILFDHQVIGDITVYKHAKNLCDFNPLNVNLDQFMKRIALALKDFELLSQSGVLCYDMMYNILMGYRIYIIDTLEYCFSNKTYQERLINNLWAFNLEIMYFLVDGLFLDIVRSHPKLGMMYENQCYGMSILEFIAEFRNVLSEMIGFKITYLREAKELRDLCVLKNNLKYERDIVVQDQILCLRK